MPSNYLDPADRVIRLVPKSKLLRDEDGHVLGVIGAAFTLRDLETYLSVTWCEYFDGAPNERLRCAIEVIRRSMTLNKSHHFAVAGVGEIDAFWAERKKRLRFIHEKTETNPAHAAIRGWPDDEDGLQLMAQLVWRQLLSTDDADALPMSACGVSARGAAGSQTATPPAPV